jgi:hypothetical protein
MSSRLYVSHLLPEQNVQPDSIRSIRRDLDTNEEIMQLLDGEEQDQLYERQSKQSLASKVGTLIDIATRELKAARKAKKQSDVDALEEKLADLQKQKQEQKGEDQSDNTKHLVEIKAIPAGVTLIGKLIIERPIASDLEFLKQAFNAISLKPYFGAQRARGCGEVSGSAHFRNTSDEGLMRIQFGGFKPAVVQTSEAVNQFLSQ